MHPRSVANPSRRGSSFRAGTAIRLLQNDDGPVARIGLHLRLHRRFPYALSRSCRIGWLGPQTPDFAITGEEFRPGPGPARTGYAGPFIASARAASGSATLAPLRLSAQAVACADTRRAITISWPGALQSRPVRFSPLGFRPLGCPGSPSCLPTIPAPLHAGPGPVTAARNPTPAPYFPAHVPWAPRGRLRSK